MTGGFPLLKLPKDLQDFLLERMPFGDAVNCLRTSRELYFDERHWTALYHRFFGRGKGGRKKVFAAVRKGVVQELLLRSVYENSPSSYFCAVEAVRIIPNVAFAVRFHEQGDGSAGPIQDPAVSVVESGDGDGVRVHNPIFARITEQTPNHARGWLWYAWITDAEEVFFRYGSNGYSLSETIALSKLDTGANTAALVRQGVRFHIPQCDRWVTSHGSTLVFTEPRGQLFWETANGVSRQGTRVPASHATFAVPLVFGAKYSFSPGTMYGGQAEDATEINFTVDAAFVRANPNLLPWIIF